MAMKTPAMIRLSASVLLLVTIVSCLNDPEFVRKRDDRNYRVVHGFVESIDETAGCNLVNAEIGVGYERNLFECRIENGVRVIRNLRNGTVVFFQLKPQLGFLAEKEKKSVILDTMNRYAFWVDDGVLVGFSKMTAQDIDRFSEYQKAGRFEELWGFKDEPLAPVP